MPAVLTFLKINYSANEKHSRFLLTVAVMTNNKQQTINTTSFASIWAFQSGSKQMSRNPLVFYQRAMGLATATASAVIVTWYGIGQIAQMSAEEHDSNHSDDHKALIEVDLLDKIASKPYLTYHNVIGNESSLYYSTLDTPRRLWNKLRRRSHESGDSLLQENEERELKKLVESSKGKHEYMHERPKGIPKRLRVLAIDVPQFKEVFDGECAATSRIFDDDIAPRKRIHSPSTSGTKRPNTMIHRRHPDRSIEVIQKSLAQSLVRCRNKQTKKIGVDITETSLGYRLNPHNMRRTYQVGMYNYDPAKRNKNHREQDADGGHSVGDEIHKEQQGNRRRLVTKENITPSLETDQSTLDEEKPNVLQTAAQTTQTVLAEQEDEVYAPWHQYAWIEELNLRINGHVPFGAKMETSTILQQYVFGNSYKSTVPSLRPWYNWVIPTFLYKGIYAYRGVESDGIDGDHGNHGGSSMNRASCKPHVVIADASSLQRVPGSLRYLVKCCMEADVPLFIINDDREWGGSTHVDLKSAALDIRQTVKARLVARALLIKEGGLFERGRILGQLETEAKWQTKELGKRTRQAMQDAINRHKKEREDDWSLLGVEELEQRLVDRKLIMKSKSTKDGELDEGYSKGFVEVCQTCLGKKSSKEN